MCGWTVNSFTRYALRSTDATSMSLFRRALLNAHRKGELRGSLPQTLATLIAELRPCSTSLLLSNWLARLRRSFFFSSQVIAAWRRQLACRCPEERPMTRTALSSDEICPAPSCKLSVVRPRLIERNLQLTVLSFAGASLRRTGREPERAILSTGLRRLVAFAAPSRIAIFFSWSRHWL